MRKIGRKCRQKDLVGIWKWWRERGLYIRDWEAEEEWKFREIRCGKTSVDLLSDTLVL